MLTSVGDITKILHIKVDPAATFVFPLSEFKTVTPPDERALLKDRDTAPPVSTKTDLEPTTKPLKETLVIFAAIVCEKLPSENPPRGIDKTPETFGHTVNDVGRITLFRRATLEAVISAEENNPLEGLYVIKGVAASST